MKINRKTQLDSEIPTASMPDIIFMLLIFFMVTTVLREYSGLPISLPKAKRIEKLKSKRHTSHIWVSKEGLRINYIQQMAYDMLCMKKGFQIHN